MRASIWKSVKAQFLNTVLFAALSPAPQAAAQATTAPALPAAGFASPSARSWRVRYMGGPAPLKRSTEVELTFDRGRIVYRERRRRPAEMYSIPASGVTDVSAEVITGRRDEKLYGDSYPDLLTPCAALGEEHAMATCGAAMLGPEALSISLKEFLSLVPYTDRFVRITWREPGRPHAVAVFQVRAEDYAELVEAIESAAPGTGEDEAASAPARQAIEPAAQAAAPRSASPASSAELFNDWWKHSNPYELEMRLAADRVPLLNLMSAPSLKSDSSNGR
ncbi:MAG TPA: hypothetical protein VGZ29_08440 [Terriglobia bacterium]|nr:hypothetical protein [Terriglobia bacterium]